MDVGFIWPILLGALLGGLGTAGLHEDGSKLKYAWLLSLSALAGFLTSAFGCIFYWCIYAVISLIQVRQLPTTGFTFGLVATVSGVYSAVISTLVVLHIRAGQEREAL